MSSFLSDHPVKWLGSGSSGRPAAQEAPQIIIRLFKKTSLVLRDNLKKLLHRRRYAGQLDSQLEIRRALDEPICGPRARRWPTYVSTNGARAGLTISANSAAGSAQTKKIAVGWRSSPALRSPSDKSRRGGNKKIKISTILQTANPMNQTIEAPLLVLIYGFSFLICTYSKINANYMSLQKVIIQF